MLHYYEQFIKHDCFCNYNTVNYSKYASLLKCLFQYCVSISDYLSKKKTLTTAIVITEAMPSIGRVNLPSSIYTADSESIDLFLPLVILIIVLTLLVALLTIKVIHKTGKMTKVPSQNLHGNRLGYSQHHQPQRRVILKYFILSTTYLLHTILTDIILVVFVHIKCWIKLMLCIKKSKTQNLLPTILSS